ncbi:Six-hairpin glycosidase [Flagelloscypha sp. PMI_526]|nr:Six-hairpin glycosidase [Flagelloscypha sp. PMI_526]
MHLHFLTFLFPLITSTVVSAATNISYAAWMADSGIRRNQANGINSSGKPQLIYDHGVFWEGLKQLYADTGNETYFEWILNGASNLVDEAGVIIGSYDPTQLDPLRVGPTFIYLYDKTGDEKWKTASTTLRSHLGPFPRTPEGQFWHKLSYVQQGWLDGIYMGDVFYSLFTKTWQPDNTTAWEDIELQFNVQYKNTIQNPDDGKTYTGLLYHGYDYSKAQPWASEDRGHSPEIWDRALGWYFMAMVDTLEIMGSPHVPGYKAIRKILQELAPRLVAAADPDSGVWWLVMTQPGRERNYFESSGTAMFIYSLLKALRLGYIHDTHTSTILKAAKKGYEYMTSTWVLPLEDGTFNWNATVQVGSLGGAGNYDYYVSVPIQLNDLKGQGAFLLASVEYERCRGR